jgi:hypothetical protein
MVREDFLKNFDELYKILLPTIAFLVMAVLTATYYFFNICKTDPKIFLESITCPAIESLTNSISLLFLVEIPFIGISILFYIMSFISAKIIKPFRLLALIFLYISIAYLIIPYFSYIGQLIGLFYTLTSWVILIFAIFLAVKTYFGK